MLKNRGKTSGHGSVFFAVLLAGTLSSATPVLAQTEAQAASSQTGSSNSSYAPPLPTSNSGPLPDTPSRSTATYQAPSPGIAIPAPPPPSSLSLDESQLAVQAEEAAMQAQAKAESLQQRREQEHIIKSYDRASSGLLPLTTDQIRDFMHKLENTQEAASPPWAGPPKGTVRLTTLTLDPGVEPPQVNLAAGYVSTITIVDATGAPWPILDVGVGGNFEVTPPQAGTGTATHVVRIMPLVRYGTGNISVLLKDLPTPIIFRLAVGGPSVDMRYDARVPKLGPNAKIPLIDRPRLEAGDKDIIMILDNAPPSGAKRMKISGLDARTMAWALDDKIFVRTPLTLLSPAWNASVSSADGMKVYEIGDAPVLLMSDNGAMLRGKLVREDDHD